jgi:glutamate racemase
VQAEPAPLFVALAEEGLHEGAIADSVADHYLKPMFAQATVPDTLVLGCTHFPMLAGAVRQAVGDRVVIVDSAATTAASVDAQLRAAGLETSAKSTGGIRLLATDSRERFANVGSRFLQRPISPDEVELVDL